MELRNHKFGISKSDCQRVCVASTVVDVTGRRKLVGACGAELHPKSDYCFADVPMIYKNGEWVIDPSYVQIGGQYA